MNQFKIFPFTSSFLRISPALIDTLRKNGIVSVSLRLLSFMVTFNALLRNRVELEIGKILRKKENGFRKNLSTTSKIYTLYRFLEDVRTKLREATILFVDFSKAFDSIHREKMEQILLAKAFPTTPQKTVTVIMMLYKNSSLCLHPVSRQLSIGYRSYRSQTWPIR